MVACAKLGLRVKYIGTVGDDERGRVQMESLLGQGINLDHVQVRTNCPNQTAYILIDQTTGERTVLWRRPDCLRLDPDEITPEQITCARLLHIDGHDTPAVARAARDRARSRIPVTVDVDTIYHGFDKVLPNVDYLICSSEFPVRLDQRARSVQSARTDSEAVWHEGGGDDAGRARRAGARRRHSSSTRRLSSSNCVDTTGAGDVFHGAFCYAVLAGLPMREDARLVERHGRSELHCHRRARRHRDAGASAGISWSAPSAAPTRLLTRSGADRRSRRMIPLRDTQPELLDAVRHDRHHRRKCVWCSFTRCRWIPTS